MDHRFVEVLPTPLEPGVLYISGAHNIVAHLCCCGCGTEVVTPLGPAGWALRYDGRVSLSPSIGNGAYDCKSHYVIQASHVRWLSNMTLEHHVRAQARDQAAALNLNLSRLDRAKRMVADLFRRIRR
ncbi:hypothetical protein EDD32_3089 [Georgenia muralis]|uniref:Uncharacterized protein n=2 Tax=Georgenia muralis TaxID=154117 RepID=A0A3N4Z9H9_9MICO|nr:hypothetical protein EDD32_3089 [Georgenia muralis]